jgi:hypothetical protein
LDEDHIGLTLVLSYLIETAFLVGYSPVDMDELLTEGRNLLSDAQQIPQGIQGQLWLQIGFAAIRGIGNFSKALSACQTGYMLAKQANNSNLQCQCLVLSKLACAYLGEFKEADILNRKIQRLLPDVSIEIQTFDLSAQCVMNIYRGRRREAQEDLQRFEANIEKYGLNHYYADADLPAAGRHLKAGFEIMTARQYTQIVVVHRDDLACACLLALKLQVMENLAWVCKLLVENANVVIVEELQQLITKTRKSGLKRLLKDSLNDILRAGLPLMEIHTLNQFTVRLDPW